jgi:hypothetical protein
LDHLVPIALGGGVINRSNLALQPVDVAREAVKAAVLEALAANPPAAPSRNATTKQLERLKMAA